MIEARKTVGRTAQRWPGDIARESMRTDTWLFAQAILGDPVTNFRESEPHETAENELREWLEAITYPSPTAGFKGASQQRHLEWLAEITSSCASDWDSSKHPRGALPENPGWFSPTGGGASAEKDSGTAAASLSPPGSHDHERVEPNMPGHASPHAWAKGDVDNETLMAQLPQSGAGSPPKVSDFVFGRPFGNFPRQQDLHIPPDMPVAITPANDPKVQPFGTDLAAHVEKQIPSEVRSALIAGGVKTIYTESLDRHKNFLTGNIDHAGGIYSPMAGTIFVPRVLHNGDDNTFAQNNVRHETGHAFDDLTNGSLSPEYLDAYRADLKKIPRSQRENNPAIRQFVPEKYERPPLNLPHKEAEQRAAREAFAQSFASATATPDAPEYDEKSGMSKAREFRRLFPKTNDHMKSKFLPNFITQQRKQQLKQQPGPSQNPPGQPRR